MASVPADQYSNKVVSLELADQPSAVVTNGEGPVRRVDIDRDVAHGTDQPGLCKFGGRRCQIVASQEPWGAGAECLPHRSACEFDGKSPVTQTPHRGFRRLGRHSLDHYPGRTVIG